MRLSEIRLLLHNPTHWRADDLAHGSYTKKLLRGEAVTHNMCVNKVIQFLRNRGMEVTQSEWTGRIVILSYRNSNGSIQTMNDVIRTPTFGYITQDEFHSHGGFRCESCLGVFQGFNRIVLLDTSEYVCRDCAEQHYHFCDHADSFCSEGSDDECCDTCPRARRLLLNYSTDVTRQRESFRSLPNELLTERPLWLGVELEVEPKSGIELRECIIKAHEAINDFAILKPDSSVPDGFEIVSVPATLAWHRKAWPKALEKIRGVATSWRAEDCGMHVHFAREALTPLQLGKVLVFVNKRRNQRFISHIAGRGSNEYAQIRMRKVKDGRLNYHWDHHDALAVSHRNNGQTMEMRIFRGNLSEYGFLKNLDFVAAIVAWSAKASIKCLDHEDFVSWIERPPHRKSYPYLDRWLTAHGYYNVKRRAENHPFQD